MTLILDLPPAVQAQLETEAVKRGTTSEQVALDVIERAFPTSKQSVGLAELFRQWEEEDSKMSPEEIAQEEADFEQFKRNINANRAGGRLIYPE